MFNIHGLALVIALALNAAANVMMKVGMTRIAGTGGLLSDGPAAAVAKILGSPIVLIGLLCFALNAGFYMFALQSKALKISIAYPVMVGGGYAIIATAGFWFLSERLSAIQWAGVLLVLTGVILIASQMK